MSAVPLPPEVAMDEPPFHAGEIDAALESHDDGSAGWSMGRSAVVQRWQITDDGSAEWAMAHVATVDAELAELARQAELWTRRIAAWFEQRATPLQRRRAFFAGHLERYALARRAADEKAKTLVLPSGRVKTIAGRRSVQVTDPEQFRAWAEDHHYRHPEDPIVRARYDLDAAEAKARLDVLEDAEDRFVVDAQSGEVVGWADIVDGEPTAKVVPE